MPDMTWKELGPDPCPPIRPKKDYCGTLGRKIKLTANFFPVTIGQNDLLLSHYDVVIKDSKGFEDLPKKKKQLVFEAMKEQNKEKFSSPLAYDSVKNAYCVGHVQGASAGAAAGKKKTKAMVTQKASPEIKFDVTITNDNKREDVYSVTLKSVNSASLKAYLDYLKFKPTTSDKTNTVSAVTQMMEVMFRHYRAQQFVQVSGRSFFSMDEAFGKDTDIGGGKLGVKGFFGSLRPAVWKDGSILLNLDVSHTAFYKKQPVTEYIKETQGLRENEFRNPINDKVCRRISKDLKDLKVRMTHANRTYRFLKLTPEGADNCMFMLDAKEGNKARKISVKDYMLETYKIQLKYPKLNCMHVGNPSKKIFIPLELGVIEKGQHVRKKLSDKEVAVMVRSSAVPPRERLQQTMKVAEVNKFQSDVMLKALHFTISDKPLAIEGRVLEAPNLSMGQGQSVKPREGKWRMNKFHTAADLSHWAVLNYDSYTNQHQVMDFIDSIVKTGREMGMTVKAPLSIKDVSRPMPFDDFTALKTKNKDLQLVLCVLPPGQYYGAVKKAGDTEVKLISQCVQGKNVQKNNYQTVTNLLLKINAKAGGNNNIVSHMGGDLSGLIMFKEPVMVMGADVNHPAAGGSEKTPSVAAIVGSCDLHATKYAVERRIQEHRTESIQNLTEITGQLLKNFYKKTGKKPSRIIMYRDGVSESQFKEVLSKEMLAMREACLKISKTYRPGITFICVQKRHHTRLYCDAKDGVGKCLNIPPGTVVDRDITHPSEIDFYLCSHEGIQGTSRPAHYHVLWDDNDIPIDELQSLTYKLCHVYVRCTRSVSIPAPAYYAHLAAFRAKVYIAEILNDNDAMSMKSGSSGSDPKADREMFAKMRQTAEMNHEDIFYNSAHFV